MKVFLTGATGFVGAQTALALLDAGHELRLLVRTPEAAGRYFKAHGHHVHDIIVADMRDADTIRQGMSGCDAVLHAAAAVSLDPRKARETYDNNVSGMKAVIGSACELGIGNIVYVSSLSVLMQAGLERIDEDSPLIDSREPYSRSKRDSDEYARWLQRQGYPIQISYPSAVIGPEDPRLSEANHGLVQFVSQMLPNTTSGFQCVDVRDLAAAHRYLLEHPPAEDFEKARYIIGGHYYPWAEMRRRLEAAVGRRLFSPPVPGAVFRAMGAVMDVIKKLVPIQTAVSSEAMAYVTRWTPADSSRYLAHSGQRFRPGEETFSDTLRWLVQSGHLSDRYAAGMAAG